MMLFVSQYSGIGVIQGLALPENESLQYPLVWHRSPEIPLFLVACACVGAEEIPLANGSTDAWASLEHEYTESGKDTHDTFSRQSECRAWDVHADHAFPSNRYSCVLAGTWPLLPQNQPQILTDHSLFLLWLAIGYFCSPVPITPLHTARGSLRWLLRPHILHPPDASGEANDAVPTPHAPVVFASYQKLLHQSFERR